MAKKLMNGPLFSRKIKIFSAKLNATRLHAESPYKKSIQK